MMPVMSTVMLMVMLMTLVTTMKISSEPVWHRQGQCVEGALVLTKRRVGKASQAIHLDSNSLVGRSCFVSVLFFHNELRFEFSLLEFSRWRPLLLCFALWRALVKQRKKRVMKIKFRWFISVW